MTKTTKRKLSCANCYTYFGSALAKFNTIFAFNLHASTAHVKVNVKRKQFKCDCCNYKSSQKGHLIHHVAAVHEGKWPFKCEFRPRDPCNFPDEWHGSYLDTLTKNDCIHVG